MRLLLVVILALYGAAAAAQLRAIPEDAKRGSMTHREVMTVDIDGKLEQLAPGAQIRDVDNRLVPPAALPPATAVRYLREPDGQIRRVWILSPEEAKTE